MVYDFYIGESGNTFFLFLLLRTLQEAMILMANGKSGEEKALGIFPVYKTTSAALASDVWNSKGMAVAYFAGHCVCLFSVYGIVLSTSQSLMVVSKWKPPKDEGQQD